MVSEKINLLITQRGSRDLLPVLIQSNSGQLLKAQLTLDQEVILRDTYTTWCTCC